MIQPNTLAFFEDLKAHNHKAWFDAHRPRYEAARRDILTLTETLIAELSHIDPSISDLALDPRRCLTRINRDALTP